MEETLFYAFGIALVLSALALSAMGLRSQGFPASRVVLGALVAYFVVLVGATSTFAVLNAREEQRVRDEEHGGEQTVKVSSPVDGSLVFEPETLTAKAGSVTIEYDNPSPVDHSVAIEAGSETLAESEIVTETTTSATADLEPGEFVFYCTVPGHRESGMEGTLTVE